MSSLPSPVLDTFEPRSPETDLNRRKREVAAEQGLLWGHIKALLDSDRIEEGLALCRIRITDPLAHLHLPAAGTPDELRVIGYSMCGLGLYKQHVAPDAPFPDPQRNHDVVRAYKRAAEGAVRYYEQHAWQMNHFLHDFSLALSRQGDQLACVPEYERLVELYKEVCKRKRPQDLTEASENREEYKSSVLSLIGALQKLERSYMVAERRSDSFGIIKLASNILEEYTSKGGSDLDVDRNQLGILVSMSKRLEDDESTEEEMKDTLSHLNKCRIFMEKRRATNGDDICFDINHARLEESYGVAIGTIAGCITPEMDMDGAPNARDLLLEGCEIFRKLSRVPENLEEGVSPSFSTRDVSNYVRMLRALGVKTDDVGEALEIYQRAFRIHFVSLGFQPAENNTPIPTYLSLLEIEDWTKYKFEQIELAKTILDKITNARLGWLLEIQEEYGPAPAGMRELLEKEAALAMRIVDAVVSLASTEEGKEKAKLERADALIFVGKAKFWQEANDLKEIRRIWNDALSILHALGPSGAMEETRIGAINTIHNLLELVDDCDPEIVRPKIVGREIRELWAPVEKLNTEEQYEEAISLCRELLADPLASLPAPVEATADELRVNGHRLLGSILYILYQRLKDIKYLEETLEAYRNATEGFRIHFPHLSGLWSHVLHCYAGILYCAGRNTESTATYKEGIGLAKKLSLSRDKRPVSEDEVDYDKSIKQQIIVDLMGLAAVLEEVDQPSTLGVLEDASSVLEEYIDMYGPDASIEFTKAKLLLEKSCNLFLSKRIDEAIQSMEETAIQFGLVIEQGENEDNSTQLYDGRCTALLNLLVWNPDPKRTTFCGMEIHEVRREIVKMARLAAGIPADLDQQLLEAGRRFEPGYLYKYSDALYHSIKGMSSDEEKITTLERAVRVTDLRIQVMRGSGKVEMRGYAEIMESANWENSPAVQDATKYLYQIVKLRSASLKENNLDPTILHHEEINLLLSLYKNTIIKAEILILKGEALRVEKRDGSKQVLEEAKQVLKDLEDSPKRTRLVSKVDKLLLLD